MKDIITLPTKLRHHRRKKKNGKMLDPPDVEFWEPVAPVVEHPDTWSHYLWVSAGVASGSVLGFLHGNVPGALIGGRFGYEAAHGRAFEEAGRIIWHTIGPG